MTNAGVGLSSSLLAHGLALAPIFINQSSRWKNISPESVNMSQKNP